VCFWTLPARCLVYEVQQEDCSTPEVHGQRSRSLFWCVEQSIGRSERIEDAGWWLLTSAGNASEGTVDVRTLPCETKRKSIIMFIPAVMCALKVITVMEKHYNTIFSLFLALRHALKQSYHWSVAWSMKLCWLLTTF